MHDVRVSVNYNGRWDENYGYVENETKELLVPLGTSYLGLLEIFFGAFGLGPLTHTIRMKYLAEVGGSPIKILHDRDALFYLQLKKKDHRIDSYPICLEILNEPMKEILPPPLEESNHVSDTNIPSPPHEFNPHPPVELIDGRLNAGTEDELNVVNSLSNAQVFTKERSIECLTDSSNADDGQRTNEEIEYGVRDAITELSPTALRVKNIYSNKRVLKKHLSMLAISKDFQFKVKRSTTKLLHVICMDSSCSWTVRATKLQQSDMFVIKRYDDIHTCSQNIVQGDHRQATSWVVGELLKRKYQLPSSSNLKPHDIIQEMCRTYGVTIPYRKAWRAKEHALMSLRGSYEEAYSSLAKHVHMLDNKNPGSLVVLETEENNQFKYFFMCLAASIQGWQHCRPVIVVEGSFLKFKYGGTLLTACGKDANEQIFPLAFGIVESENDAAALEWFFVKLKEAIGDREELTVISNMDTSISRALEKVYPNAYHSICTYHLLNSMQLKFGDMGKDQSTSFDNASRAYLVDEFESHMAHLDSFDPFIRAYLQEVGYEKWARAFFSGRRYSIMTTDIVESINPVEVQARDMPITCLIEWLRSMVQKWFFERRSAAQSMFTTLATAAEDRLKQQNRLSSSMDVHPTDGNSFRVVDPNMKSFEVNLQSKTCTCNEFQVDQIPCPHALAVINACKLSPYNYCSSYYTKEALFASYAATVHPLGSECSWVVPEEVKTRVVLPPLWRRRSDMPSRKIIEGEETNSVRCSRCKHYGHNRRTCPSSIPLSPENSDDDWSTGLSATNSADN